MNTDPVDNNMHVDVSEADNVVNGQKDQCPSSPSHMILGSYQSRVCEAAMRRNIIAVLDTGGSKTTTAAMLIRNIGSSVKLGGTKKLIIFLTHLVLQQFDYIKQHTNLEVGMYQKAKGESLWTVDWWEKEVNKHDVLLMTPSILLHVLWKAFLNLDMVCLLVIDECHLATGNHPCAKIMKEFYHKSYNKPKIFGMTASLVIRKELESILDCLIYTMEDRTEIEEHVPSAKEICRFYAATKFSFYDLKVKIEASWSKFDALFHQSCDGYMDDKLKSLQKRLSNHYAKILHCLDNLGLICAHQAVMVSLEDVWDTDNESEIYGGCLIHGKRFLEEVLSIIRESLPPDEGTSLDSEFDSFKAKQLGYISPKLHELVQIFQSLGDSSQVLCVTFFERIITAKVIERFLKRVTCLSHFKVSYLAGCNTPVDALGRPVQIKTLDSFCPRKGKCETEK